MSTKPRFKRKLIGLAAGVALVLPVAMHGTPASAAAGPALSIDAAADNRAIDPGIYGINGADPTLAAQIALPLDRWGGDHTTEYNWKLRTTNQAANYFFEAFDFTEGGVGAPEALFAAAKARGGQAILTLPTMGWIATEQHECQFSQTKYGKQTASEPYSNADCGTGLACPPGTTFVVDGMDPNDPDSVDAFGNALGFGQVGLCHAPDGTRSQPVALYDVNDPTDANICPGGRPDAANRRYDCNAPAQWNKEWVQSLVQRFGTAASGGVAYYGLDNEPGLWFTTHRGVHPACPTYDEITSKSIAVAAAAKSADPSAKTLGPVAAGFHQAIDLPAPYTPDTNVEGYHNPFRCENSYAPTAARQANGDFVAYYLRKMREHEQRTGTRVLDYLDIHHYPQQGTFTGEAGDTALQQARLESTRALWDPNFLEPEASWLRPYEGGLKMRLIPRMRDWVGVHYPGTKLALTEYNFGALEHLNGALTQADVLGIFAREGVSLANLWETRGLKATDPGAFAFKLYRNYDGQGSRFGDTWVRSTSADQSKLAVYGAKRTSDGALTVMVVNKTSQALESPVTIAGFTAGGPAQIRRYSGANLGAIVNGGTVPVTNGAVATSFPASSITLLVIPGGGTTPPPPPPPPGKTATTTVLKVDKMNPKFGKTVELKATVRSATGSTPTGTVQFKDGEAVIGTAPLNKNGVAKFKTKDLERGRHILRAIYLGDATHEGSRSLSVSPEVR